MVSWYLSLTGDFGTSEVVILGTPEMFSAFPYIDDSTLPIHQNSSISELVQLYRSARIRLRGDIFQDQK